MIKAILIDDEKHCRETLSIQLERYCPQVKLLAECSTASQGLQAIADYQPDVVFLDIEMPVMNGFEMLGRLSDITFEVIFTTGYDSYAIKAIRFSALDYLLKPIDKDELMKAVGKISQRRHNPLAQQLDILMQKLNHKPVVLQKIALPTLEGYELVPVVHIIQCESDGNYTLVYLKNGKKFLISRTLKEIEELLEGQGFLRIHHSHLINLNEIIRYVRGEGGYVVMSDNTSVNVSRSRKDILLKLLAR
ncbi:response regulator transcription factor [Rhodocytophaga rosea]|uniref:Response regulator transcription factor n=1 Tax=Rhodocytophaga rosea TaxID=2704465 RepID=A0A6C0GDW6_9BACT|nr:LytTR family DNA-binding domain-containing protein [Rhodocytophaga rosea]QHT66199.1 response regulator transcription factor [Rhodocytophaga rosea]